MPDPEAPIDRLEQCRDGPAERRQFDQATIVTVIVEALQRAFDLTCRRGGCSSRRRRSCGRLKASPLELRTTVPTAIVLLRDGKLE